MKYIFVAIVSGFTAAVAVQHPEFATQAYDFATTPTCSADIRHKVDAFRESAAGASPSIVEPYIKAQLKIAGCRL